MVGALAPLAVDDARMSGEFIVGIGEVDKETLGRGSLAHVFAFLCGLSGSRRQV